MEVPGFLGQACGFRLGCLRDHKEIQKPKELTIFFLRAPYYKHAIEEPKTLF